MQAAAAAATSHSGGNDAPVSCGPGRCKRSGFSTMFGGALDVGGGVAAVVAAVVGVGVGGGVGGEACATSVFGDLLPPSYELAAAMSFNPPTVGRVG